VSSREEVEGECVPWRSERGVGCEGECGTDLDVVVCGEDGVQKE
jgi:hypothetical protein